MTSNQPARAGAAKLRRAERDRDCALLHRIAAGDEAAMAALYDRLAPAVQSLVLHIVGDPDEAEDVVEETFWQAWRTAGRYDARRGSVSTWLLITARCRALDRVRARRRRAAWRAAPATIGEFTDGAANGAGMPDAHSVEADRADAIGSALSDLPREQREVIELAFMEGLSHSQIAQQTSQPLGTVKTRMRIAMRKLAARLGHLREDVQ